MDFAWDRVIDRKGSDSEKWGRYADQRLLPLWVADMDFQAPPPVLAAMHKRLEHAVFGYGMETAELNNTVVDYVSRRYAWEIKPEWIVWLPGLVSGLNVASKAIEGCQFTVIPVYPPFMSAPRNAGRPLATTTLLDTPHGWRLDFEKTDRVLAESDSKLWLLCHPHNPVGKAWTDEELLEISKLAQKHDLVVCSDEIHCDLTLDPGRRHTPYAMTSDYAMSHSITLMAPSKTYNIPGLGTAWAIIPDEGLKRQFSRAMAGIVAHPNVMGMVATQAALSSCDDWLTSLLEYLRGNAQIVERWVASIPELKMHSVEATYLAWIDASELCRKRDIMDAQSWFEPAGVMLSPGRNFSPNSAHYARLNFGCPRATLQEALDRLANTD